MVAHVVINKRNVHSSPRIRSLNRLGEHIHTVNNGSPGLRGEILTPDYDPVDGGRGERAQLVLVLHDGLPVDGKAIGTHEGRALRPVPEQRWHPDHVAAVERDLAQQDVQVRVDVLLAVGVDIEERLVGQNLGDRHVDLIRRRLPELRRDRSVETDGLDVAVPRPRDIPQDLHRGPRIGDGDGEPEVVVEGDELDELVDVADAQPARLEDQRGLHSLAEEEVAHGLRRQRVVVLAEDGAAGLEQHAPLGPVGRDRLQVPVAVDRVVPEARAGGAARLEPADPGAPQLLEDLPPARARRLRRSHHHADGDGAVGPRHARVRRLDDVLRPDVRRLVEEEHRVLDADFLPGVVQLRHEVLLDGVRVVGVCAHERLDPLQGMMGQHGCHLERDGVRGRLLRDAVEEVEMDCHGTVPYRRVDGWLAAVNGEGQTLAQLCRVEVQLLVD